MLLVRDHTVNSPGIGVRITFGLIEEGDSLALKKFSGITCHKAD